MTRSEFGAVARLAWRTAHREWKRTLLIVLLIAVPVAAAIVTAGLLRASALIEGGVYVDIVSVFDRPHIKATLIAAALLAEVALVAGAAYATGTRRRLREIGLLGATGATASHVRLMVIAEGLVAGIAGATTGAVAAIAVLTLGQPVIQPYVNDPLATFPLDFVDIAGPAVVAIAAAITAAWIPARTASRVSTTTALMGRTPLRAPSRWVGTLGVAAAALGGLFVVVSRDAAEGRIVLLGGAGVILMIAGTALLTGPLMAWAGRHADRFPATARLVLRDSARQRTRAAAATSAIMVVLVGLMAIAVFVGNLQARDAYVERTFVSEARLTSQEGLYLTMGSALLVVLVIVAIVTALSATESDHDVRLMVAVGAPPSLRRRFLGLQAALFVFIGGLLASPLGVLLMEVTTENEPWLANGQFRNLLGNFVTVPWLTITFVTLAMPVIVAGVTALVARSAPTVPPRPVA